MSNTSKLLGIKTYKLTEEDNYLLDKLEGLSKNDPEQKKKIMALESTLKLINNDKGRAYAISNFLNKDPFFSKFKQNEDLSPTIGKYWDPVDDYVPPDIQKMLNKKDEEDFWNWSSDRHWLKRTKGEMERRAKAWGYTDVDALYDALKEEQALKDFKASLTPGEVAVNFLFPRTAEAIEAGKYNDKDLKSPWELLGDKNVLLDMGENLMYSFDPAGRVVREIGTQAAKKAIGEGSKKAFNVGSKVIANSMNPLIMEGADATFYDEDDNTDRSKFSGIDVLFGTGINNSMDVLTSRIPGVKNISHKKSLPKETLSDESIRRIEVIKDARAKNDATIETLKNDLRLAEMKQDKKAMAKINYTIKELEKDNEGLDDLIVFGDFPERKTTTKERTLRQAENLVPDALSLISNKSGDAISEDPKTARRFLRLGFPIPMAGPIIKTMSDAYYDDKNLNKERDAIDKQLELIYGLQDWGNE